MASSQPIYVLPYFLGGPADKQRIPDDLIAGTRIRMAAIEMHGEVYFRQVKNLWLNCDLVYFLAKQWDRRDWAPVHAGRLTLDTHPDLRVVTRDELFGSKKLR